MRKKNPYALRQIIIAIVIVEVLLWMVLAIFYLWVLPSIKALVLQRPWFLLGNVILTALSILHILFYHLKNSKLNRFASSGLMAKLSNEISTSMSITKYILYRVALFCIIIALINPRYGSKEVETKQKGIDIFIALDVSNSMMAEDIKPNRLTQAKMAIEQLVNKLHNDRLGIVIFAGDAYVQLPITSDFNAAKIFLDDINANLIPLQGTAIGKAIELSKESFDPKSDSGKVIIVISDGENHEDDAIEAADDEDIMIYTIGVGSNRGSKIPFINRYRRKSYKKDRNGKVVISKMNKDYLKEIAEVGGGEFSLITDNDFGFKPFFNQKDKIETSTFTNKVYEDYEDRFQLFLLLAFILIMIESLLPDGKLNWFGSNGQNKNVK